MFNFLPLKLKIVRNAFQSIRKLNRKPFEPNNFRCNLSEEKIFSIHSNNLNPVLKTYYKKPLILTQGYLQYVWDNKKKRYLDMFGGIVTTSVGHCHPKLVDVIKQQASKLWHVSSLYYTEEIHEYTEKLLKTLPDNLNNIFFCNSGSEANELAILLARLYTSSYDIISLKNGYHGCSATGLSLNGIGSWKHNSPSMPGVHHVTNPDPYRGKFGSIKCRDSLNQINGRCDCTNPIQSEYETECSACVEYLNDLKDTLDSVVSSKHLAAFIAESIQGVGGTVQYPRDYLKCASKIIKKRNGLLILDEVQTGFGRTGKNFWGFQNHQINPDIITMAKGMGNGFPLAAVVTSKEIAKALDSALYFNTYGGNPLACKIGSTVLDIIKDEELQKNSFIIGNKLLLLLNKLKDKYEKVGDVRGLGLMIGVELVENKENKVPLSLEKINNLLEICMESGLLIGKGGPKGSVIRIKPPMCINKDDVDFTFEVLDYALSKI